jgi:hypothetical protein
MTTAPSTSAAAATRCTPKGRSVALPVLSAAGGSGGGGGREGGHSAWQPNHPKLKHSRAGKWRAAVLILVHVLIAVHILHWFITG